MDYIYARPDTHNAGEIVKTILHLSADITLPITEGHIFVEKGRAARFAFEDLLDRLHPGDCVIMIRMSQLGLALDEVLRGVASIAAKGANIRLAGRDEQENLQCYLKSLHISEDIQKERDAVMSMRRAESIQLGQEPNKAGRKRKTSDDEIAMNKLLHGTVKAAKLLKMSKSQFIKRFHGIAPDRLNELKKAADFFTSGSKSVVAMAAE